MIYFESNKSICIKKIPHENSQFTRCEKALRDNSLNTFFDNSDYSDFKLVSAYRIENNIKLTKFEKKLSLWHNAVLKGLFSVIDWNQVPNMVAYGISDKKSEEFYEENVLRVPRSFIKSWNLPEIVSPTLEKSSPVELPFHTSIYSTSKFLEDKMEAEESDAGKWFYLVLSRAIVSNQNKTQTSSDESKPQVRTSV